MSQNDAYRDGGAPDFCVKLGKDIMNGKWVVLHNADPQWARNNLTNLRQVGGSMRKRGLWWSRMDDYQDGGGTIFCGSHG